MSISLETIKILRERTGVGVMDAKAALEASGGDVDAAVITLRKSGQKIAEKKQARETRDGTIGVYLHSNKKLLGVVALACETDFVARTEDFQTLAHDFAMHVAAANPEYLNEADIPEEVKVREMEIIKSQPEFSGKPAAMLEKIIEGKLQKFGAEHCFLLQPYFKDSEITVGEVLRQAIQKLGENIQIRSFYRVTL
jgi:elongation factor Ts